MQARYFEPENRFVRCNLCPHNCLIADGEKGTCGVRGNTNGSLISLNYSKLVAIHADPVEKKPLYHFLPGSRTLSLAATGCNLQCSFCQNCSISVAEDYDYPPGRITSPEAIINLALRENCTSIAFTYSEPTVWYEFMFDIAAIAKQVGLKTILVSNGYIASEPLINLLPLLDAANIDLKAFTENFYRNRCKATLSPVLETLKIIAASDIWLEITTLLIEDLNSSEEEIDSITQFILSLNKNIPWHISRFFPNHKMQDKPAGQNSIIYRAVEQARAAGLKYIYAGNTGENRYNSTFCSECGEEIISRHYYSVNTKISGGLCPECQSSVPGVWSS